MGKLHSTYRWQQRRARQLRAEPLCRMCLAKGIITSATVADHIIPHRDNTAAFWHGELQSLCAPHHDSTKQSLERGGQGRDAGRTIGVDGWAVE
jgi:5-methylcytosine-specific restriction endonuclease McrA